MLNAWCIPGTITPRQAAPHMSCGNAQMDLMNTVSDGLERSAHRCRFIGDSEVDHRVANDAGMPFYFMTYGYAAAGWQPDCAGVFDDFDQLVEALLSAR